MNMMFQRPAVPTTISSYEIALRALKNGPVCYSDLYNAIGSGRGPTTTIRGCECAGEIKSSDGMIHLTERGQQALAALRPHRA